MTPKPPTIEAIRASVAFRNITEAMNHVFGHDWRFSAIWPEQTPPDETSTDFVAAVDILGRSKAAYINAAMTHMDGYRAYGPGGLVGISVPTPGSNVSLAPDGTWIDDVEEASGVPFLQISWPSGASGICVNEIVEYLQILKRYLETHPEPKSSGPTPWWTKADPQKPYNATNDQT